MVIEKTSRKDNITPKTFSKLAYEKDVNEQFPKGIFFSLFYFILFGSVRARCLMNKSIILTKISNRKCKNSKVLFEPNVLMGTLNYVFLSLKMD